MKKQTRTASVKKPAQNNFAGKTVLAVDSSDTPLKMAILFPDGRMLSAISADVRQERNVIRLARRLLSAYGLGLADVERVFALRGPGRFTGIRIGLTLASVLRELNNAEICSATVLETLARQSAKSPDFLRWQAKNPKGKLAAITCAFRQEFFCQIFDVAKNGGVSPCSEPQWLPAPELKEYLSKLKFPICCFGWAEKRQTLAPYLPKNCFATAPTKNGISPKVLIEAALSAKPQKEPISPLYLKPARYELMKP